MELRVKREEEERKRLEEVLRAQQEEERKRLEEEELARRKQVRDMRTLHKGAVSFVLGAAELYTRSKSDLFVSFHYFLFFLFFITHSRNHSSKVRDAKVREEFKTSF